MLKNIFPLSLQGVLRKKRSSILIFTVLLISFAFSIVSLSLVDSISKTNTTYRLDSYGEWYFAIPSGLTEDEDWLKKQPWVDSLGTMKNYGFISSKGSYGFGTMDNVFRKMGHLRLDEGHWPKNENEVAVEARVLSRMGRKAQLGQTITLNITLPDQLPTQDTIGETTQKYILCGIIHDYSELWMINPNRNNRNLVSFVVTEKAAQTVRTAALSDSTVFDHVNPIPQYFMTVDANDRTQAISALTSYMGETRTESYGDPFPAINSCAYTQSSAIDQDALYTDLIAVVALLAVLCAYIMQMPSEAKSYATLRSIGITKMQLSVLLLAESMILCIPAMLLGIPLSIGITHLALRLLLFSGSVPIRVSIPWNSLCTVALLWIFVVLFSRFLVLLVTLRTPLVGKFQMQAEKARRSRLQRTCLILLLNVSFGFTVIYTVLSAMQPLKYWRSADGYPDFSVNKMRGGIYVPIEQETIDLIKSIPGVENADGFSILSATVSYDKGEEQIHMDFYAVDPEPWDVELHFGTDAKRFENGEIALLCVPEHIDNPKLPQKTVTIRGLSDDGNVCVTSSPTRIVTRNILKTVQLRGPYFLDSYSLVVSHTYMKNLLASMEESTKWDIFYAGAPYGYARMHIDCTSNAESLSTERVIRSLYGKHDLVENTNDLRKNLIYLQNYSQELIYLFTAGGSVSLMLLLILCSCLSLETEQEKKAYRTLRVIGMSKRQMGLEIFKKAAFRVLCTLSISWIIYFVVLALGNANEFSSPIEALRYELYWLHNYEVTLPFALVLTIACIMIYLLITLFSKKKLRREVTLL